MLLTFNHIYSTGRHQKTLGISKERRRTSHPSKYRSYYDIYQVQHCYRLQGWLEKLGTTDRVVLCPPSVRWRPAPPGRWIGGGARLSIIEFFPRILYPPTEQNMGKKNHRGPSSILHGTMSPLTALFLPIPCRPSPSII